MEDAGLGRSSSASVRRRGARRQRATAVARNRSTVVDECTPPPEAETRKREICAEGARRRALGERLERCSAGSPLPTVKSSCRAVSDASWSCRSTLAIDFTRERGSLEIERELAERAGFPLTE